MMTADAGTIESECEEDVARKAGSKAALDPDVIERGTDALVAAGCDARCFADVLHKLANDPKLRAGELIAIANKYAVGGAAIASRAAALKRIKHRFVELQRTEGNIRVAKASRPW